MIGPAGISDMPGNETYQWVPKGKPLWTHFSSSAVVAKCETGRQLGGVDRVHRTHSSVRYETDQLAVIECLFDKHPEWRRNIPTLGTTSRPCKLFRKSSLRAVGPRPHDWERRVGTGILPLCREMDEGCLVRKKKGGFRQTGGHGARCVLRARSLFSQCQDNNIVRSGGRSRT